MMIKEEKVKPKVLAALSRALDRHSRTARAEALLREALDSSPGDPVLSAALVDLLEGRAWMREAVEALEAWHASQPGNPVVLLRLMRGLERKGRGDLEAGRLEESIAAFSRALELSPGSHVLRFDLADAYQAAGRKDDAAAELARAAANGAERPKPEPPKKPAWMPKPHEHGTPGAPGHRAPPLRPATRPAAPAP